MINYMDKKLAPEERAKVLLADMSIEEKMGQVVGYITGKSGDYDGMAKNYPHGAGQVSCLEMRAMDTIEEVGRFQREIQERIMVLSEHHIPAIFHMEGLCGAYIPGAASFPSGIGRASTWDPELEYKVGQVVGRQERAAGITHTFAPVLDISRDSRMGRQGETYGEDPTLAAALGTALTKGLQSESTEGLKTEAVAKHFLGFHASQGGIHGADCEISEHTLQEVYAKPFQAAISEGHLRGIMPCYCSINGQPVSAAAEFMTDLLRKDMGFDGVTVSDYCAVANIHNVQKVCESLTEAGLRAMAAGMDMELHFKQCYNDELAEWFASGKADTGILDQAVLRILTAKFRMGLFEHPFALEASAMHAEYAHAKDQNISLETAFKSLVLLKNDGILPISRKTKKIAVIGCHAETARIMYGGYTHFSMAEGMMAAVATMAGLQTEKGGQRYEMKTIPGTPIQQDEPQFETLLKKQNPGVKSLLEQLKISMPEAEISHAYGYPVAGDDCSGHEEALRIASKADLVIITLGGKHGTSSIASMGEGIDATDINLPVCQELFLEKLGKLNKPVAGIHFNGRPLSSDAADQYVNALLEAWNPAEGGAEAITAVLLGAYNPGGRLPVSVARAAGQIPVYYNHPNGSSYHQGESIAFSNYVDMPHTPRYCFGHGLSYTEFTYSDLQINKLQVSPEETIRISVKIQNTGERTGDEVVQLYIKDTYASMTRPVMELAGFKRLTLKPEGSSQVTFEMKASQMAFLDRKLNWKVEAGEYQVMIGASSEDIRLEGAYEVAEDGWVDGKTRGFYATAIKESI